MPAPAKNQYAAKENSDKVRYPVNVRGTEDERRAWRRAAAGQKWNDWARKTLNAAAQRNTVQSE